MKETQEMTDAGGKRPFTIHDGVGFSPSEKRLLLEYCGRSNANRWSWYAVYLVPMIVFAGYGVLQRDVIAIAVAFGALLLFIVWSLYGGIQNIAYLKSIFRKYEAYITHLEAQSKQPLERGEVYEAGENSE